MRRRQDANDCDTADYLAVVWKGGAPAVGVGACGCSRHSRSGSSLDPGTFTTPTGPPLGKGLAGKRWRAPPGGHGEALEADRGGG